MAAVIPEPGTFLLSCVGFGALALFGKAKRRRASRSPVHP